MKAQPPLINPTFTTMHNKLPLPVKQETVKHLQRRMLIKVVFNHNLNARSPNKQDNGKIHVKQAIYITKNVSAIPMIPMKMKTRFTYSKPSVV
jgi:hypothetical protein